MINACSVRVARDVGRDDRRSFRIDRISAARITPTRFVPRDPPEAATFVAEAVSTAPYRYRARVRLAAPAAVVAERVPPTVGAVETVDDGSCRLTTGADSLDVLALHLAMLGCGFTVLEPPELAEHVRALGQRLRGAAERGDG